MSWDVTKKCAKQSNEIADGYGKGDPLIYIQQELQKASELTDWGLEAGAR